jgi:hypothetical protein
MHPEKRRRGRSAMRILINNKPVEQLTPKLVSSLMLGKELAEVKGRVLSGTEATETYIRKTKRLFTIVSVAAIVFMLIIIVAGLSYEPRDAAFLIVGMVVIVAALLLFMIMLLRHRVKTWNAKLQHRSEGLAPPGTAIFLDDKGLAVGSSIFPWSLLAVDQVELTAGSVPQGEYSSTVIHLIERLALTAGDKTVVLDSAMMENGALLVGNAWRKLPK